MTACNISERVIVDTKSMTELQKATVISMLMSVICVSIFSCVILIFGKQILGIYIVDSQEAIKWGMLRLTFVFAPLVIQGVMEVITGSVRGLGISIGSMLVSIACICGVRILWCLTIFNIPAFHTPQILFVSYPISWVTTVLLQTCLFVKVYKKQKKKLNS